MWEQVDWVFTQAFHRLGSVLAADLPGFVAMLVVILSAVLVAYAVRGLLGWGIARAGFDRRAREWGMTEGRGPPRHEPSWVIARGAFWLVVAVGIALSLAILGASATSAVGVALLEFLSHLVIGVIIVVAGVGAARFLERTVLIGAVNLQIRQARILAWGVKWVILVLASAMALQHVGIGGTLPTIAFAIVVGGIVLAAALAFGLGAREAIGRALERRPEDGGLKTQEKGAGEDEIHHL